MHKLASSLIVLCAAGAADARPKPEKGDVAAHMERAAKAHKEGKFEVALDELQAAYALEPQPKLLFAMAQVHAKLDQCEAAIDHYRQFLDAESDRSKQVVVQQAIAACEKRLAEKAQAESKVAATVEPPPPVQPKPEPTTTTAAEPPPPPRPLQQPAPSLAATAPAHSPWYTDVIGDALVVAGVGAAVGSVVFYRRAQSDLDSAEAAPTLDRYREHRDGAERNQLLAVALAGGGVALLAAGVLRFALRDSTREARSVAIVPTAGGGLVAWSGGF